ncbi:MAG: hypothetical protein ACI4OE_03470 [Alphaproteobacteria bacterium]|nr:hypothetical protein [Alphaproteobacteria bacterium]MDY4690056.1 hypothetical protein [Alphaproteobacteria bacterium]
MAKAEDASIDSILKSIREAIIDKEQRKYFEQFLPEKSKKEPVVQQSVIKEDIFELSKNMIVKREDIPYQLGVWSFDDVAKKIMKKYQTYFAKRAVKNDVAESNDNQDGRVRVKENYLA